MRVTRRAFLMSFLSSAALPFASIRTAGAQSPTIRLGLTPQCNGGDKATIAQGEGPFFKPNSPLRQDLAGDVQRGSRITIAGFVLDERCRPVPGARLELWHADDAGNYDNAGFRLRGYQHADDRGRWWFATILPAAYPGRTRHYHFKVQRSGGRLLTTQLYFPGEPLNRRDSQFDERLLLNIDDASAGRFGRFDFIV